LQSGQEGEIKSFFEDRLSDASVPFEDAVADMLDTTQRVTAQTAETPVQPERPTSEVSQPPKEPIDIPYGPIGIGVGVLGVFGAGAVMVRNRQRFNAEARKVENTISDNRVAMYDAIEKAKAVAGLLPTNEAEALVRSITELEEANARVNSGRLDAETALAEQRHKFVRSTSGLQSILQRQGEDGSTLSEAMQSGTNQAEELLAIVSSVNESINTIDDSLGVFAADVTAVVGAQAMLKQQGYTLGALQNTATLLQSVMATAQEQRQDGAVLAVQDLLQNHREELTELAQKTEHIPKWHEQVVERYASVVAQKQNIAKQIEIAQTAAAAIRTKYSADCIGTTDTDIEQVLALQDSIERFVQATPLSDVQKKDVDSILAHETAIADVEQAITEAVQHASNVTHHLQALEQLQENLPQQVDAIAKDIDTGLELANEYGDDVEQTTVEALLATRALADELATQLQAQKPAYLTIDGSASELAETVRTAAARVQSDRAEMVQMRVDVQAESDKLSRAISELKSVAQSHASDVGMTAQSSLHTLEAYEGSPRTRTELRSALETITQLMQAYNSVASAVSADIQIAANRRAQASRSRSTGYGGGGYSSSSRSSGSVRRSSSSSSSTRRSSGSSRRSSSRSSGSTKRR
jgi:hypothetical protein